MKSKPYLKEYTAQQLIELKRTYNERINSTRRFIEQQYGDLSVACDHLERFIGFYKDVKAELKRRKRKHGRS